MAHVDVVPEPPPQADDDVEEEAHHEEPPPARPKHSNADVEVEREVTKRHMIEAITQVLVVLLYMAFTLIRDREAGVVVLDGSDNGPEDDWAEN